MARPLYAAAADRAIQRGQKGHAGLWFDKFCDQWRVVDNRWTLSAQSDDTNPKLAWIDGVAQGRPVGDPDQIAEALIRMESLVSRRGGRSAVFETESRFVTGLGRNHPIENGFAWHPTLGTPYLAGSSVKGLVRAWARQEGTDSMHDAKALLGDPGNSNEGGSAGRIAFLDAIPIKPVGLQADIMTPHYAAWDAHDPPGDWRSPTPIPFLTTAMGSRFWFGLVPSEPMAEAELDRVLTWLKDALAWAGAGAKTAVGYGRMVFLETKSDELKELAAKRAQGVASPSASTDQGTDYVARLRDLEAGRWRDDPAQQRTIAEQIRAAMEAQGHWKPKSAKKNPAKDKEHQRTLAILRYLLPGEPH